MRWDVWILTTKLKPLNSDLRELQRGLVDGEAAAPASVEHNDNCLWPVGPDSEQSI